LKNFACLYDLLGVYYQFPLMVHYFLLDQVVLRLNQVLSDLILRLGIQGARFVELFFLKELLELKKDFFDRDYLLLLVLHLLIVELDYVFFTLKILLDRLHHVLLLQHLLRNSSLALILACLRRSSSFSFAFPSLFN